MKIFKITCAFFFLLTLTFGVTNLTHSNIKDLSIHKSKRVFVKEQDRPYIKKKKIEPSTIQAPEQKSVVNYLESGNDKADVQDYKGALGDFNKALLFEPKNVEIIYYCAFMKFQMEDFANSITDYDLAISIDTTSVELYFCRGNAKFELKYFREAMADYDQALKLDSTDSPSYYNRAIAKYNAGEKDSFCKDLQYAIKYGDKEAKTVLKEFCQE